MRRPSGRSSGALRERLRRARYAVADVVFVLGRGFGAVGRKIASVARGIAAAGRRVEWLWWVLPVAARRALVGVLAAAAVVAFFVLVAVPALPCEFPGGDECAPPDDAAEIVPAEALAYAHVNLDPATEQYELLRDVASHAPGFSAQLVDRALALLPGPGGEPPDYETDVEPWFGGEAAIAVVPGPSVSTQRVILLEASDERGARGFAESVAAGVIQPEDHRGIELMTDQRDVVTAQVESFLVIGSRSGVRAIIDTATAARGAVPLSEEPAAEDIRDQLPEHRFVELWASRQGAADLIGGSPGTLGSLAPFVSPGGTDGAGLAVTATENGLELAVRSRLDPEREKAVPGFFAAFPSFDPSLAADLAGDSLAYLGLGDPGRTVRELLGQAAAEAPGIASGFEDLVRDLRKEDEVDIEGDLLGALGDEGAFAIDHGEAFPYLEFIAKGVDEERARGALAALQKPLVESVDPGVGLEAPVFGEQNVNGIEVRSLRVSPVIELSYAVFDGLAAIATDPAGIGRLAEGDGGLEESEGFRRATEGFEGELALLAYFDLGQLLAEAFELGLAEDPAFNAFANDFRALQALGVSVRTAENVLATDARLLVGAPDEAEDEPEAVPPGD